MIRTKGRQLHNLYQVRAGMGSRSGWVHEADRWEAETVTA